MTVDGERSWIGTSNWSEDYFHSSRNAGVLLEGRAVARALERKFDRSWNAPYAHDLDPAVEYEKPVIDDGDGR
jgi:phosphatidylserine/phosphatidylglycerophosphate/cardiolipin synthase-like enzyme